jgi:hypothetical protein
MCRSSATLNLRGRAVAVDSPVLLDAVGGGGVLLPVVVERGEEDEVAGEVGLEVLDCGLLVLGAGDSLAVGATRRRPASLSDDNLAASVAAGLRDALGLLEDPLARLVSGDAAVEEGVAVGCGVVADGAKLGVVNDGNESVDRDDGALVGAGKSALGGGDGSLDVRDAVLAVVDTLVTDGKGVDDAPVTTSLAVDSSLELGNLVLNASDLEESSEYLHVLGLGGLDDGASLVAVDTVHADHVVAVKHGEILGDLVASLAGLVRVVRGVGDAMAGTLGVGARGGVGRGGRLLRSLGGGGSGSLVRRSRSRVSRSRVGSGSLGRRRGLLLLDVVVVVRGRSDGGVSGRGASPVGGDGVAELVNPDHLGGSGDGSNLSHIGDVIGLLLGVTVTVSAMLGLSGDSGRQSGEGEKTGLHVDCC